MVDDAAVRHEAEQTVYRLAQGPTVALGRIKRLLASSPDSSLADQLAAGADSISVGAAGAEAGRDRPRPWRSARPPCTEVTGAGVARLVLL